MGTTQAGTLNPLAENYTGHELQLIDQTNTQSGAAGFLERFVLENIRHELGRETNNRTYPGVFQFERRNTFRQGVSELALELHQSDHTPPPARTPSIEQLARASMASGKGQWITVPSCHIWRSSTGEEFTFHGPSSSLPNFPTTTRNSSNSRQPLIIATSYSEHGYALQAPARTLIQGRNNNLAFTVDQLGNIEPAMVIHRLSLSSNPFVITIDDSELLSMPHVVPTADLQTAVLQTAAVPRSIVAPTMFASPTVSSQLMHQATARIRNQANDPFGSRVVVSYTLNRNELPLAPEDNKPEDQSPKPPIVADTRFLAFRD